MTVTESVGCDRNERRRPLVLRALVPSAHPGVRQRGPGGMHRDRPGAERVLRPAQRALGAADAARRAESLHPGRELPGHARSSTARPTRYLDVEPKAVRFRILNAANDRGQNLQLYVAADKKSPTTPGSIAVPCNGGGAGAGLHGSGDGARQRVAGQPVRRHAERHSRPGNGGSDWWIQIGTEGGFMPAPVVVPPQPIGYNLDPAVLRFRHRQPALAVPRCQPSARTSWLTSAPTRARP